jgi:hypothetical protein
MKMRLLAVFCVAAFSVSHLRATEDERPLPNAERRLREIDVSLALHQYERVQMELFETRLKLDLLPCEGDPSEKFRLQQTESLQKRIEILRARADALRQTALAASQALPSEKTAGGSGNPSADRLRAAEDDESSDDGDEPRGSIDLEAILPEGAKVVAGGLLIEWTAPDAGTAILVETCSGRAVKTQSVSRESAFKFDPSDSDVIRLLNAMFADPNDVKDEDRLAPLPRDSRFVLYFVPVQEGEKKE